MNFGFSNRCVRPSSTRMHRRLEVVVPDPPGRHPTKGRERRHVPVQERLLDSSAVRDVDRPARVRQPHHEHVQLATVSRPDRSTNSPKSTSASAPGSCVCGTNTSRRPQAHLDPRAGDSGHRDLREDSAVLAHQALPHPPRGVPLLTRLVQVGDQPSHRSARPRAGRRPPPRRIAFRAGGTAGQRRPHRPTVHPVPLSQLPDRPTTHPGHPAGSPRTVPPLDRT